MEPLFAAHLHHNKERNKVGKAISKRVHIWIQKNEVEWLVEHKK
jgi:hypothetical protein